LKPNAVAAAEECLSRAKQELAQLEAIGDPPTRQNGATFKKAWSDFLVYANRVYGKLEQGAKKGPGATWFDAVKKERLEDPVLDYIHEARNADDHGIEEVASAGQTSQTAHLLRDGKTFSARFTMQDGFVGGSPDLRIDKSFALMPVRAGRKGVLQVPHMHLGNYVQTATPLILAELMISRLEMVIEEAKAFLPEA